MKASQVFVFVFFQLHFENFKIFFEYFQYFYVWNPKCVKTMEEGEAY